MEYCGIDAHSKSSTVCVLDAKGKKLMMKKTESSREGIAAAIGQFDTDMPVVVEACSASRPVIAHLRGIGFKNVIVVNPAATAQMRARGKKTDSVDAQGLAELARLGLTEAWRVHIPSEWAQNMRDLLYSREFAIKQRVMVVNRVKAIFRREGKPSPSLKGKSGWEDIEKSLPKYLDEFSYCRKIREESVAYELGRTRRIKEELKKHPQHELVMSVPNVGPLTAAVLLACIDDISRFGSYRAACAYFGVVPRVFQSGDTERTGSITKRGNRLARKFLAQAAHHARYASSPFNAVYREMCKKKNNPLAIIAIAKKIVTCVYAVMKHNKPFDPVKMGLEKVDEEIKFVRAYKKARRREGTIPCGTVASA